MEENEEERKKTRKRKQFPAIITLWFDVLGNKLLYVFTNQILTRWKWHVNHVCVEALIQFEQNEKERKEKKNPTEKEKNE